jgi:hypothetical protein
MAINFFESNDKSSGKPFVDAYLETGTNIPTFGTVRSFRKTRKGTGYLLETDECIIFLFNGSQILKHLLEALSVYVSNKHGFEIQAHYFPQTKEYKLGVDSERACNYFFTEGSYYLGENTTTGWDTTTNPFLLPSPHPTTRTHARSKPS